MVDKSESIDRNSRQNPTILDVAREAGVSKSTVSRALANTGRVSAQTRENIVKTANRLGYKPNMVFSVMGSGNLRKKMRNLIPLAYLYETMDGNAVSQPEDYPAFCGAAERYGYYIDCYDLSSFSSARDLLKILRNRGYCGVVIGRIYREDSLADKIDLSEFSVICSSNTLREYKFNRVAGDPFAAVRLCWEKALAAGYRRIGVAHGCHVPALPDDDQRHAATLQLQASCKGLVLEIPPYTGFVRSMKDFVEWFKKWRPDCVIGFSVSYCHTLKKKLRLDIPGQCGFACLHLVPSETWHSRISGIIEQSEEVAQTSISLIDQEIRNRARGIPGTVLSVNIEPKWFDGGSL